MKTIITWLKRAAMLSVTVAFAVAGFGANAATELTLNDGDTLQGVYEDYEITIAAGATVTFNNATVTRTSGSGRAAIDCAGNATIVLAEGSVNGVTNTVNSCAAIHPATNATLTIRGSGSLDAYSSGDYGAGIGAASARSNSSPYPCGNIVIEGGTITAQGGSCGAGVGAAAWSSPCGDITITGNAVVTASSGQYAAAIGAASDSSPCGNITISGNASVTAKKDAYQNAAGIGACHTSPCGNIVIDTTGTVDARGSNSSAIGASYESTGTCGDISIMNGTIFVDGGDRSSGIGATFAAESGRILISGGTITAEGEADGAGIGARGATSSITISGGVIDATGGTSGAGIGSCNNTTCADITITEGVTRVVARKGMSANASVGAGGGSATVGTVTISPQLERYDYLDGAIVVLTHESIEQITPVLTTGGAASWYVEGDDGLQPGAWRSGVIGDLTNTWLKIAVSKPCKVYFRWKVSSEGGYDYLRLYLNGAEQNKISGTQDWAISSATIESSIDDLKLSYGKDRSTARDNDCGWVKDISVVPFDGTVRTVTVDSNCQDVNSYNVYVVDGYTFEIMPPIARYGYSFLGFFTAADGGEQVTAPCTVTANTTIYAHWAKTLDFDATGSKHNDADAFDPSDDSVWCVEDDGITWHSGAIGDNTNSWARFTLKRPGTLSFKWKVSSEANNDRLRFYVDGVEQSNISGDVDWADVSWTSDDARNHVAEFRYSKDGSQIRGQDCGWVKDVVFAPFEDVLAVNLDLNYDGAEAVEPRYVKRGNAFDVDEIPNIPRPGYALLGWFTDAIGGEQVTVIASVTAGTSLHARWVKTGDFEYAMDNTNHKGSLNWTLFEKAQDGFEAGTWRTGPIGDNQETWIETTVDGPCTVFFKWKVSSEATCDYLRFYVGEEMKVETSGDKTNQWAMVSCELADGSHVLRWLYHKDRNNAYYQDCGWVKDIVVTQGGNPYTVTWMNGIVALETDENVEPGDTPSYDSALPTRAATAQYYYDFAGWEPEFELVSSNTTYTAKYTATLRSYDVTWQNEDGTSLGVTNIFYGATPTYSGATPTKAATPKFTYTFAGWDPEVAAVTGEATYTATYAATINKYTITWKNDDGSVIDAESVEYDETPTHANPTKASTAQYHYEFAGWDPAVASVTGEATYTATFNSILRSYTITWKDDAGAVIDTTTVNYGATPSHAAPTKASTAQYDYTFAGWGNVVEVSGEATYQATFTPVLRSYTVSWVVEGETVASGLVAYGTTPVYGGATPTKVETAEYTYTFAGWSPAIASVSGEATYTAQFNSTKRSYTITWANIDGAGAVATSTAEYGTTPSYGGATPTKAETAEYTYTFAGWSPAVVSVTGAATYTAQFNATPKTPEEEGLEQDGEGYYLLGSAQDWMDFAELVKTAPAANARMTADIDLGNNLTMVGTSSVAYQGVFDGQGKTLTVNYSCSIGGIAPFQYVGAATIMNLHVDGRIATSACAAGGIAGAIKGSLTVSNCWVSASISAATSGDVRGTIGGIASYCNTYYCDILIADCLFTGAITNNTEYCAGFMSNLGSNTHATMRNCLNAGTFPTSTSGCGTFSRDTFYCTLENCLYKTAFGSAQGTLATAEDLADGTTAAALQAGRDAVVWVQDTQSGQPILATFYTVPDEFAGYVKIGDVAGFEAIANNLATNYVLMADIDLQNVERQPFGEFSGVFDGNGYAIKNISITKGSDTHIGLFSKLNGATIRSLTLEGGRIEGYDNVGGIAGEILGDTLIEDCTVNLMVFGNRYTIGGLVGHAYGGNVTIRRCRGFADVTSRSGESGGLVGVTNSDNLRIEDSYAEGILVARNQTYCGGYNGYSGGLVGLKDRGSLTISNCYHRATMVDNGFNDRQLVGNGDGNATIIGEPTVIDSLPKGGIVAFLADSNGSGTVAYVDGEVVATPDEGSVFIRWEGEIPEGSNFNDVRALAIFGKAVATAEDLQSVGDTGYYVQTADIDMSGVTGFGGIGASGFSGEYDGRGHEIRNLSIDNNVERVGLFRTLRNATLRNIRIVGGFVKGYRFVGALAGFIDGGGALIENCSSTADVNATIDAGGLVGNAYDATIRQCYAAGNVTSSGSVAGGFINWCEGLIIEDCYALGNVNAGSELGGGFIACSEPSTYRTVTVLTNCYSVGAVTVTGSGNVGGFTARDDNRTNYGCYWDKETSGRTTSYGVGVTGLTTAQMKSGVPFEGWDTDVWKFTAGMYPRLRAFVPKYTVTWLDEDGETVLGEVQVDEFDTPVYGGATPTKAETAEYTYTFAGWTPAVAAVESNTTYTATYDATLRSYTITWKNDDGSTIDTTTVAYGEPPTHAAPTKAETAEYTYTFAGWSPVVASVTGAATYTATFNATPKTPELPEGVVDLSTLTGNYTAQNGDTLTGATGYEITIAAGATVTLDGVAITNTTSSAPAVKCLGDATIVLAEGSDNSVVNMVDHYSAIYPSTNATLTIQGSGSLHVAAPGTYFKNYGAAIGSYSGGSSNTGTPCGNIVISGGNITAVGGYCGAGVGACSYDAACGDITITGDAVVHATGGAWAAGIGAASDRSPCGSITISGNASVTATSTAYSDANSAGIGAGYDSTCGDITISTTGTVEAQGVLAAGIGAGGYFGAACAGITITSGIITATGGGDACAIGASFKAGCGDILIEGGTITATGGEDCPGVGALGETASITITGGNVTAIGGSNGSRRNGGAGIGSMYYRTCGNITISGGTVTATGGAWAAGIGSGYEGTCSNITISAGMVTANVCTSTGDGETDTVAIGAGCRGTCGNILISGGTVVANATNPQNASKDNSSAIGATYYNSKCGDITITDGITSVTATKGATAQQHIGQGDGDATIGTVTISPRLAQSYSIDGLTLTLTPLDVPETVTITWVDEDGTTLATDTVAYGTTPAYGGETPTKAEDAQYTYEFAGWTPAVGAATSNITYTATFSETLRSYTVAWVVEGVTVASGSVEYGQTPAYGGDTPMKESTAEYSYEFSGWSPTVSAVTGAATYTATFEATKRSYTVSWVVEGATVASGVFEYGATPTYSGATPAKESTAEYSYEFTGWSPTIVAVAGEATYTAQFSQTKRSYTVAWVVDGMTVASGSVEYGATPVYGGDTPTKESTAEYSYEFTGWSPAVVAVTGDATYTAQFAQTKRSYMVTWVVEGETVASGAVEYGATPTYGGDTPTKESTAEYSYTFTGWSPAVVAVTGDATYTAQFSQTKRSYTVSWVVEGMTVASGSVEYGQTPAYDGATPTKESTAEYSYAFTGWSPAIAAVTGEATYTAQFSATKRSYTVAWVVEGATVASGSVEYGQTPTYGGDTPTKESTAEYSYEFSGWSPAVSAVTGDATYTAQFSQTKRSYTVAWVVDGMTVASGSVEYGATPVYGGDTPTKESTAEYSYEFTGWSPAVVAVTGDATYTAQFLATKRSYTVSWVVEGATVASGAVEYGQTPAYDGATPTKSEDANYTYTFSGWTPSVASVTGPATYTATFSATPKEEPDPDAPYDGTETINGIAWSYTVSNGVATITGANPDYGNLVVPDVVEEDIPVTAIEDGVFADCNGLESVTIGRNIVRIGDDVGVKTADWAERLAEEGFDGSSPAFGECESLMNFYVAEGNTVFESIGGALYYRDTPASAKTLALYPSGRDSLDFPEGIVVTKIGDGACAWCHQFTEMTIPASVREIGVRAFDFCREMTSLVIPSSVTNIGYGAFLMNIGLENVEISGTNLVIGDYAFAHGFTSSDGTTLVLNEGIASIGRSAFQECWNLVGDIVIPEGVTSIGRSAFSGACDVSDLSLPDTLTFIGAEAFCGCSGLTHLVVPLSVEEIEIASSENDVFGAFANCFGLTEIYMPLSLKPATDEATLDYLADVFYGLGLEGMPASERDAILTWYSDPSEIGGGEEPVEEPDEKRWMVVDLRTGGVSYYGYDFDTATNTFNTTEYKTVKMAFRKVPKGRYFVQEGRYVATMERDYYIALFATTEAQYRLMLDPAANVSGLSKRPQGSVSWMDLRGTTEVTPQGAVTNGIGNAAIYRLNERTGLKFDLPTIPMWEVASLAKPTNATATASWPWFFGSTIDALDEYAWNENNYGGGKHEVGLLKPNAWGLYDVYGNVWEWCADGLGTEYWTQVEAFAYDWKWNQTPNGDGRDASCRHCAGGSAYELRKYCDSVYVNTAYKVASYPYIGFRLALICDDEPSGDIVWRYTVENGEATITGAESAAGDVVIPDAVQDGVPVTSIGTHAFVDAEITSVVVPNSVTNICAGAFVNCTGLRKIYLPRSLKPGNYEDTLDYLAAVFEGLSIAKLDEIVVWYSDPEDIPIEGVVTIDGIDWSYSIVRGEATITGASSFGDGVSIPTMVGAYYVTAIGDGAFYECANLSAVTIDSHIRTIGNYAFARCPNVVAVNFQSGSHLETIGAEAFMGCAKLQRVTIPDSVTVIRGGAFSGCSELYDVTIGRSVAQIGDGVELLSIFDREEAYLGDFVSAFGHCASLMNFKVASGNATYEAIDGCIYYRATPNNAKTLAVYPSGRSSLYFHGGVTVTGIGEGACSSCNKLTNLSIPETVRDIGVEAFAHCEKLAKVYIAPNTVTNISFGAFVGDMSIMDAEIAGSVKTIGDGAFLHCFGPDLYDSYTTGRLVLNEGIQTIGVQAFFLCFRIGEIVIPNSVTSIGESAFGNTQYARSVAIGSGVREISESAFECDWGGSQLSELVIGPNVVKIGAYAFAGCEKLRNLNIPPSVQHIGDYAFSDCTSLCALNLPPNLKSIGTGAFGGSSYGMMMSSGRALLGSGAQTFDGCTDLRRVLVPNSVTNIGVGAFGAVTSENLDRIYLPSSLKSADDSDTLAFLADQFPGLNLGVGDVTWYGNESELNYVTVTFDPNNGGETESVQVLDYLDSFPVPVTNGYAFAGWWTTSDDSGEQVTLFRNFDENTTLYAHWVETPVTFGEDAPWKAVYDDDLGDWVIQSGDVAFGYTSSASMTVTGPCIVTYSFKNIMSAWGTSNDLKILVDGEEVECWGIFDDWTERTIEVADAGEHTVTWRYVNMNGDINDYAQLTGFNAEPSTAHTVTFHLEGGTMAEATSRQVITSLGTLPTPTKDGVLFAGWYTAAEGGDRITSDYEVEDDLDLYAHWTVAPFEIGGDVGWYVDEDESYTCEHVGIGQRASAQITFTGSRRIQFSWRLSGEEMTDDNLVLYVDGEQIFTMHGDRSWEYRQYDVIGDGGHVVRWEFRRMDYSYETGDVANRMWLKNISTTPLLEVTFNPNYAGGETIMGGAVSGTPYGELPSVKRKGYRLVGWFTAATGGTEVTSTTVIREAMTLYAHWEETGPEISYELTDSFGDGWNGNAIRVVNAETEELIATLTIESGREASGEIPVVNGMRIRFEWVNGSYASETAYTIRGVDGEVIVSGSGSGFSTPVIYEVVVATPEPSVPETPPVEIDDTKMEEPVVNEDDGTRTINAKEGETLTQSDVESVSVVSPTDPTVDITEAYTKTLSPEGDKIVLTLAQPVIEEVLEEENKDEEDPTGLLEDVTKIEAFKVAELPIPDISDPDPEKHEEVGALPMKMHKGLWYQASWGDDLNNLTSGEKFQANGTQTHIGVIKQTGAQGFYKISVSEK